MKTVTCPNCGNLMHGGAVVGTTSSGKRIVDTCSNKWGCGTVVRKEE